MSEVRFGSYRVVETLGAGALSTTYKAVHEPLERTVALKALKSQMAPTSSFGEQLDREAKILADLVHPNIVLLLDQARSASGRPYLVLEHVDGPSVAKLLAKKRRLGVEVALAIGIGIAAALEHAHERGVVHRDVKPSNVLLSRTGAVKMIDFGIAQRARTPSVADFSEGVTPSGKLTHEPVKDAFGTPAYMSPEQILGDFVDGRSDLFSLGVVLYEMTSGARPFDGALDEPPRPAAPAALGTRSSRPPARSPAARIATPRPALRTSRREAATPLRDRAPDVPRAVERIVMRLLEKSPADRYANAAMVRERLESALRALTREDPASIVRAELEAAGFAPATRRPANGSPEPPARRSAFAPLWSALAGHAVVLAAFAAGVFVLEGSSCRGRDGERAAVSAAGSLGTGGGVRVVASPWAHVRVDGQDVDTTPFARAIPLAPGKHWITLTHPSSPPVEREVDVERGEVVTLDVTMPIGAADAGRDAR